MIGKSAFFLDETEQVIIPPQVPSHPTPFFLRYRVHIFTSAPIGFSNIPWRKPWAFSLAFLQIPMQRRCSQETLRGFPGCTSFLSVIPCLYATGCQTGDVCAPLLSHHPV